MQASELTRPVAPELELGVNRSAPLSHAQAAFARDLDDVLGRVRMLLRQKNAAYGDSALDPVRVFSKASPEEQIRVRIDDKLSRLARGSDAGEDVLADLLGYLVLLEIAKLRQAREAQP